MFVQSETEPALCRGDSVYLIGLSRSLQATSRKSIVTNPYAALNIGSADCPRYRATNMEVIELDTGTMVSCTWDTTSLLSAFLCHAFGFSPSFLVPDFGSTFSGVLTDEQGRVRAIWGSFSTQVSAFCFLFSNLFGFVLLISEILNCQFQLKFGCSSSEDHQFIRGIPIDCISQVLEKIITGANGPALLINGVKRPMPRVRILEVELYPTLLSKARSFGLSDNWIQVCVLHFSWVHIIISFSISKEILILLLRLHKHGVRNNLVKRSCSFLF